MQHKDSRKIAFNSMNQSIYIQYTYNQITLKHVVHRTSASSRKKGRNSHSAYRQLFSFLIKSHLRLRIQYKSDYFNGNKFQLTRAIQKTKHIFAYCHPQIKALFRLQITFRDTQRNFHLDNKRQQHTSEIIFLVLIIIVISTYRSTIFRFQHFMIICILKTKQNKFISSPTISLNQHLSFQIILLRGTERCINFIKVLKLLIKKRKKK